jgi:hypothetical protein
VLSALFTPLLALAAVTAIGVTVFARQRADGASRHPDRVAAGTI